MPVYEYRCTDGHDTEALLPLDAAPPEDGCPVCGNPVRKRFSRVAVRFGGWGFNATDSLVRDPGRTDFKQLRDRAERIADGGA